MKNLVGVIKSKKVIKRVLITGGTILGLAIVGAMLKPNKNTDDSQIEEKEETAEVSEEVKSEE